LQVKENKNITDDTPYGGVQVLAIDTEGMPVVVDLINLLTESMVLDF
jgi:hypothetical protein